MRVHLSGVCKNSCVFLCTKVLPRTCVLSCTILIFLWTNSNMSDTAWFSNMMVEAMPRQQQQKFELSMDKLCQPGQYKSGSRDSRKVRGTCLMSHIVHFGWDLLSHPPYSTDLSPSDFHLFRSMQHFLEGKTFVSCDDIKNILQNFFDSERTSFFLPGYP